MNYSVTIKLIRFYNSFLSLSSRLLPQRCVRSVSVMECLAPALCAPAGCGCLALEQLGTFWRTALMEPPEWYMPTKAATARPTALTPATCSLRIQHTNCHLPATLSTSKSHPIFVLTMAKLARWAHQDAPATARLRRWTAVSCCAVGGAIRLVLRR